MAAGAAAAAKPALAPAAAGSAAAGATAAGGGGGFGGGGGGGGFFVGDGGGFGAGGGGGNGGGGGGGLGAGGDIFIQEGGSLTLENTTLGAGAVSGGAGADGGATGQGFGSSIFLQGNETLTLGADQTAGEITTVSGVIADQTGAYLAAGLGTPTGKSADGTPNAGTGGLDVKGLGTVVLDGANTYTGVTTIESGTLEIGAGGSVGSGNITFAGPSELKIEGAAPGNVIGNFSSFDKIDLANVAAETAPFYSIDGNGDLVVQFAGLENGALGIQAFTFAGTSLDHSISLVSDGAGGTFLETSSACYCEGTRILTERGEVAVEDLAVGDMVVTASGALRPIVWIGFRQLDIARHAFPLAVMPVRVRAGAFGLGLPHRDLWLSPQHAVFVEGVLIPIIRLANGANVAQIRADSITYFHVELESHDVLLAEGLPAESFLDCGSRSGFSNCGDFVELHPTFKPLSWDDACAPLKEEGEEVEAVRARLLAQAEKLGFRQSGDPGLHIRADGDIIWPERREGGWFDFILPEGARELKLASRSWRPADATASGDKRHLGVVVREIEIDGRRQDLGALGAGWHPLEGETGHEWRWTDGSASLPVGARRIAVRIGDEPLYWVEAEADRTFAQVCLTLPRQTG